MAEYIEREKTVKLLRSLGNREYRKEKGTIQDAIKMISYPGYTPTADVAPVVHGRWIDGAEDFTCGNHNAECSICRCYVSWGGCDEDFNYCPNCGAKMDGGADNA